MPRFADKTKLESNFADWFVTISREMSNEQPSTDWRGLIGELGQPLPKIGKADKERLKLCLRTFDTTLLDPAWVARMSLAVGLSLAMEKYDPAVISRAFSVLDIANRIEKFCTFHKVLEASIPVKALTSRMSSKDVGPVLSRPG